MNSKGIYLVDPIFPSLKIIVSVFCSCSSWNCFALAFIVFQLLSRIQLLVTPWTAARQTILSFTISWSLLKLMSIELVMPSNHLILCCPLLLPPSIFPNNQGLFQWVSSSHRWPKYWSFSFSISPSLNIQGGFPLGLTGLILLSRYA